MIALYGKRGDSACLFIGPLRIRWAGPDFRPLYSERYGHRKWYGVGRLKVRWDRRPIGPAEFGRVPDEDDPS